MSVVEKPKEVFAASCARIASAFVAEGWRYKKSTRRIEKIDDGWTFTIVLSSSSFNMAGEHVGLQCELIAHSTDYAAFLVRHGLPERTLVGRTMLYELLRPQGPFGWELADPSTRPQEEENVVAKLRSHGLPWFALAADRERLTRCLLDEANPPGFPGPYRARHLAWLAGPEAAGHGLRTVLAGYASHNSQFRHDFHEAVASFRREGIPPEAHGWFSAKGLAANALALGVPLPEA